MLVLELVHCKLVQVRNNFEQADNNFVLKHLSKMKHLNKMKLMHSHERIHHSGQLQRLCLSYLVLRYHQGHPTILQRNFVDSESQISFSFLLIFLLAS